MEANRSTDVDQHHQEPTSGPLECDLSRLDLNDSSKSVEHVKEEQLISIATSLPNPSNLSSSPVNNHPLLVEYTDDHDDEQPFIVSKQTSVSQSISSTSSALAADSDGNISVPYGVDWSDRARPASHCWFPYTSNDPSNSQPCAYVSCANVKSALLHCESCDLIVHSHHLNDSQVAQADFLPPCRPSFVDHTTLGKSLLDSEDNASKNDRHFWFRESVLQKPCMHCQQTSMGTTLFGSGISRLSTMSTLDIADQFTSIMSSISGNFSPKMPKSSSGLVCLWCSRSYHRSCWEQLTAENENIHCDYGIFRNIIVRPQWLSRSSESPTSFRAQLPSHSIQGSSEPNCFPYTPVLLFINKRSGGQVGEKIYRELLRKLNPRQVFLLENNATITHALDVYRSLPNLRICVFGGDGTVGWVLGCLAEAYPSGNNPPVSICPLGTGNDLSRVLSWGEQYDPKNLCHTLVQIPQAQVVTLDRWEVQLEQIGVPTLGPLERQHRESGFQIGLPFQPLLSHPRFVLDTNRAYYQNHHDLPNTRFINYMSFGLDAAITLDFHDQRTRDPSKFSSPWKNKLMYLNESCKYLKDFALANMWNLGSYIRLICDGQNLTDAISDCHTLVVLNIPGYASGTNPWGKSSSTSSLDFFQSLTDGGEVSNLVTLDDCDTDQTASSSTTTTASSGCFDYQDFGDRKIEVVGLTTTHMAAIHAGFRGHRIAQCSHLRIELCCPMTAQMDGEPFYLPASVAINIGHAGQVLVLKNETK